MMLEMVHVRVTTGMASLVRTAAVLRCEKQMENFHVKSFPGWSVFIFKKSDFYVHLKWAVSSCNCFDNNSV
jgi:hypothetical protein